MISRVTTNQQVQAKPVASALTQNLAALAFGAIILFAVGFMPMAAAHNAAHDTRHALAFPCH
jgi:cobalt transporter subunit CbtB